MEDDVLHCRRCAYDLRGLPAGRCPECGLAFDPDDVPIADVPWLRRAAMGTWRAYWATVWLGIVHPRRLARLAYGRVNVDPLESRAFANTCIVAASSSYAFLLVVLLWSESPVAHLVALATVPALGLFLWAAHQAVMTLDWRERGIAYMERIARLKPFTAAPLGASPAVAAVLIVLATVARATDGFGPAAMGFGLIVVASPVAVMVVWWCVAVAFHASALGSTAAQALGYGVALAALWGALTVALSVLAAVAVGLLVTWNHIW